MHTIHRTSNSGTNVGNVNRPYSARHPSRGTIAMGISNTDYGVINPGAPAMFRRSRPILPKFKMEDRPRKSVRMSNVMNDKAEKAKQAVLNADIKRIGEIRAQALAAAKRGADAKQLEALRQDLLEATITASLHTSSSTPRVQETWKSFVNGLTRENVLQQTQRLPDHTPIFPSGTPQPIGSTPSGSGAVYPPGVVPAVGNVPGVPGNPPYVLGGGLSTPTPLPGEPGAPQYPNMDDISEWSREMSHTGDPVIPRMKGAGLESFSTAYQLEYYDPNTHTGYVSTHIFNSADGFSSDLVDFKDDNPGLVDRMSQRLRDSDTGVLPVKRNNIKTLISKNMLFAGKTPEQQDAMANFVGDAGP